MSRDALAATCRSALAYLEEYRPKGKIRENFTQTNRHENHAVKSIRNALEQLEAK